MSTPQGWAIHFHAEGEVTHGPETDETAEHPAENEETDR